MNDRCKVESIKLNNYDFIKANLQNSEFIFSTAENDLNFNKSLPEGRDNLAALKKLFHVNDIGYMNQIHSSLIHIYDGNVYNCDALISNKKNIALGVFTADCVPVLIADSNKGISAAIHSGWKGTLDCIVLKTLNLLKDKYGVSPLDLHVVIGPHIKNCCYEVGEEVIAKFMHSEIYMNENIINNRMLNLEKCIKLQLNRFSIPEDNINTINVCTYCSSEYKMYSYRKQRENAGRMFSFVIIR